MLGVNALAQRRFLMDFFLYIAFAAVAVLVLSPGQQQLGGSGGGLATATWVSSMRLQQGVTLPLIIYAGAVAADEEEAGGPEETFLQRQMRLAAERWESGEGLQSDDEEEEGGEVSEYAEYADEGASVEDSSQTEGGSAGQAEASGGYEYYYEYEGGGEAEEEEEEEPSEAELEWARQMAAAKAAPKRKASGFKRPESPRPYSGILRPIAYDDFITDTSKALGCVALANDAKLALLKSRVKALSKSAPEPPKPEPVAVRESSGEPQRKQTLKEKQELKRREKEEKAKEMAKRPEKISVQLGSDCETLVCGACKAVVDEFAHAIHRAIDNPSVVYVADILQQQDFCASKEVTSKYGPLVSQVCGLLLTQDPEAGMRDALLRRFESTPDGQWGNVISPALLYIHKKEYCTDEARLCSADNFELQTEPVRQEQEEWTPDCYVCRKMMQDIEESVGLYAVLKDEGGVVQGVCDRLQLQDPYGSSCKAILERESFVDDIAWLAKVNHDGAQKREVSEFDFATSACAQTGLCPDPRAPQSGTAEMEVDAPYW